MKILEVIYLKSLNFSVINSYIVKRVVDPGFHLLALSTKMTLSLVRDFAENIVLDFDLQDYNTIMDEFKNDPEVIYILIYMLIPYYV